MMFDVIEAPLNIRGKRVISPLSSFMRPGDRTLRATREDDANVFFDSLHPVGIPANGNALAFFDRLFCRPFIFGERTHDSCAKQLLMMMSSSNMSKGDKIICDEWVDFFFARRLSLVGVSCPKDFLSRFSPLEWDMKFSQLIDDPRSFEGVVTESDIVRILTTFSMSLVPSSSVPSFSPMKEKVQTPEERDMIINKMKPSRIIFITRFSVSSMAVRLSTRVNSVTFSRFLQSITFKDIIGDGSRPTTIVLEDPTNFVLEKALTMKGCEVVVLETSPAKITGIEHCPRSENSIRIVNSTDKIPQQNADDRRPRRVIVGGCPGMISLKSGECGVLIHREDGPWFIGECETKVNIGIPFINGDVILPHHAHGRRFDVPVIVDKDVKFLPFMSSSVGIFRG